MISIDFNDSSLLMILYYNSRYTIYYVRVFTVVYRHIPNVTKNVCTSYVLILFKIKCLYQMCSNSVWKWSWSSLISHHTVYGIDRRYLKTMILCYVDSRIIKRTRWNTIFENELYLYTHKVYITNMMIFYVIRVMTNFINLHWRYT